MIIPAIVITAVTFPGFVMSSVAAKFWCDLLGVPVYEARFFKGTIVHEAIPSPWRAELIAFAPFTVNTLLCAILLFPVAFSFLLGSENISAIDVVLAWAGVSMGMHALPTRAKIREYLDRLPDEFRSGLCYGLLNVAAAIFVLIDLLRFVWFDLVYAGLVGIAAPVAITTLYMAL